MKTTSLKQIASGRSDIFKIDVSHIRFLAGFNERKEMGDLKPLADAAARGTLPPILVRIHDGRVFVVDGERRTRAAMLAVERGDAVPPISCISEPRGFTESDRTLCLLECNSGKPLTILEEARVISRLRNVHEMEEKEIAGRTGRSRTHIKNCMSLLAVPEEIHRHIEKGRITASLVIDLIIETRGDHDLLLQKVNSALGKAAEKGKTSASRKDLPTPEPSEPAAPPAEGEANPETPPSEPLTGVAAIKAADSNMGGGPNTRTGEGGTADSRVSKLNKMLEKIDRADCKPDLFEFTELLIDFLDNKRPLSDVKKFLLA